MNEPRNVLVTGASSGLGRALSLWFARRGARVWAAARRLELLETLAADPSARPGSIVPLVLDVADIAAIRRVLPELDGQAEGGLDLVIANAGIGGEANPRKDTWEKVERMIQVNVTGAAATLATLAPRMAERGRGQLVGHLLARRMDRDAEDGRLLGHQGVPRGVLRRTAPGSQVGRRRGHLHPSGLREERDDGEEQVSRCRSCSRPTTPPTGWGGRSSAARSASPTPGRWCSPPARPGWCPRRSSPGSWARAATPGPLVRQVHEPRGVDAVLGRRLLRRARCPS